MFLELNSDFTFFFTKNILTNQPPFFQSLQQCGSAREHSSLASNSHKSQRKPHHSSQGVQGGAGGRHGAAERERALLVRAGAARGRAPARVGGRVRGLRYLQPHGPVAS